MNSLPANINPTPSAPTRRGLRLPVSRFQPPWALPPVFGWPGWPETSPASTASPVCAEVLAWAAVLTKAAAKPVQLMTPPSRLRPPIEPAARPAPTAPAVAVPAKDKLPLRPYQAAIFNDQISGLLILYWSRQVGKSYTLAAWAVDRLIQQLQQHPSWLVTVLSNSRTNGGEFVVKCQEVCTRMGYIVKTRDFSTDIKYENMRMEVRVTYTPPGQSPRVGRIKVLAANPRTAPGFSGDLILDEFAFHENSHAIWEAAEPILASNLEFRCRIASTANGKHNLFYRMASGPGPDSGEVFTSTSGFQVSRLTQTGAHGLGGRFMIRTRGRASRRKPPASRRWTRGRTTRITSASFTMKTWPCSRWN